MLPRNPPEPPGTPLISSQESPRKCSLACVNPPENVVVLVRIFLSSRQQCVAFAKLWNKPPFRPPLSVSLSLSLSLAGIWERVGKQYSESNGQANTSANQERNMFFRMSYATETGRSMSVTQAQLLKLPFVVPERPKLPPCLSLKSSSASSGTRLLQVGSHPGNKQGR